MIAAGAILVVIGKNSTVASYEVGRPMAEYYKVKIGMVSLNTHWDCWPYDRETMNDHIASSSNWKDKLRRDCPNYAIPNLLEIGEIGIMEDPEMVRRMVNEGCCFVLMWKIHTELGIEGVINNLDQDYQGTETVYSHFDMDVLGGADPTEGDILGELAEPMGMTDYEAIRIAYKVGRRGCAGFSFYVSHRIRPLYPSYRLCAYLISWRGWRRAKSIRPRVNDAY